MKVSNVSKLVVLALVVVVIAGSLSARRARGGRCSGSGW